MLFNTLFFLNFSFKLKNTVISGCINATSVRKGKQGEEERKYGSGFKFVTWIRKKLVG